MERTVHLLTVGEIDPLVLINLRDKLEHELKNFNFIIKMNQKRLTLTKSEYNSLKSQYNASKILKKIKRKLLKKDFFQILGVMDEDIYSKNYNFVFGLASRIFRVGVVSLTRLRESYYKNSGEIYRKLETYKDIEERIFKEALHELGHLFGLEHCFDLCVMKRSNSLKDTDEKPKEFCYKCSDKLKSLFNE
ncbi:MAG: archaemetzincin family Zn-dependent metalloprotease [Promethearchaeota archaeon]